MWGGRLGGARANSRNLTKLYGPKSQRDLIRTSPEPRLNLADANVTAEKEDYSIIFGCSIVRHWVLQNILAASSYLFRLFLLSNVIIAHWE